MVPASYYDYARSRESGGNASAKNPRSSATGLYQFTTPTWADVSNKHPELALTADGRTDPSQSTNAMKAFTEDNASQLSKAGYDTSTSNLYLAHRFGAGGALKALSAEPNSYVSDVFPEVMSANPDLKGKRIADITGTQAMPYQPPPMNIDPYGTNTVVGPQRQPLPGALSADGVTGGEGILGRVMSPEGLSGIEKAGVYLSSIGNPGALSALSSIGPKAGRFSQTTDNERGVIRLLDSQTGKVTETRIPGWDPHWKQNDAYEADQGKKFADQNSSITSNAQLANQHLQTLDQMKTLLGNPDVYQGSQGETVQSLKKMGKAVGMDIKGTDAADVAQSLANQLSLQMRTSAGGMPGSLSDKDLAFLKNMSVSLNNQPEANTQIIDNMASVHKRTLEVDKLRQEYVKQHGHLDDGFNKVVSDYATSHPLFDNQAAAGAASAPAASGYKVIKVH